MFFAFSCSQTLHGQYNRSNRSCLLRVTLDSRNFQTRACSQAFSPLPRLKDLHSDPPPSEQHAFYFFLYVLGVHYYINTDRYAYGGVVTVRSSLDNTPQVRGAEVFALNAECTQVFYEESGSWKPYRSARNIHCTSAK